MKMQQSGTPLKFLHLTSPHIPMRARAHTHTNRGNTHAHTLESNAEVFHGICHCVSFAALHYHYALERQGTSPRTPCIH